MENQLYQLFQGWLPEMLDLLRKLVSIETGTGSQRGIEEACHLLAPYLEDLGYLVEYQSSPVGPILTAQNQKPRFLFLGHLDTVFPEGTIQKNPFRQEGDRIYGPGVMDMKGGIISLIFILKALKRYASVSEEISLLFNPDEEISSIYSRTAIEDVASKVEAAFIFEPTNRMEWIITRRKGVGSIRLFIKGRASHAGSSPHKGLSANRELARELLEMEELTNLKKGITVSFGKMGGGTTRNTIPEDSWAHIDLRFWEEKDGEYLIQKIKEISSRGEERGYRIRLEGGITRPPLRRTEGGEVLFQILKEKASSLGLEMDQIESGGVSDANFISAMDIPLLDSLGPVGGRAHSLEEFLLVDSIPKKAAIVTAAILKRAER